METSTGRSFHEILSIISEFFKRNNVSDEASNESDLPHGSERCCDKLCTSLNESA